MSDVITKAHFVTELLKTTDWSKQEAVKFVELFFDEISATLKNGENVKLARFGNFILQDKKARPGRNPRTGKSVAIKPRRIVSFHASQKLKKHIEALNVKKEK